MTTGLIDRRVFLKAGGASFLAGLNAGSSQAAVSEDAIFASAYYTREGSFGAAIFSEDGKILSELSLPARGHDVVFSPRVYGEAIVFARRPGTFAFAFSILRNKKPQSFSTPVNRHFYGHGCFSQDGKWLYATENDFETANGKIGIYNAQESFRRIGEFDTFGVGPHELLMMPDGKTLVVANGGIETHPEFGRAKLNLPMMQPSIVLISVNDGRLVSKYQLPSKHSKLSLRHMDIDADGDVWIAGQLQNDNRAAPLVARLSNSAGLDFVDLHESITQELSGYIGSISVNKQTNRVAISSSKSGVIVEFASDDPSDSSVHKLAKANGLIPHGDSFASTTSNGEFQLAAKTTQRTVYNWDNHMTLDNLA